MSIIKMGASSLDKVDAIARRLSPFLRTQEIEKLRCHIDEVVIGESPNGWAPPGKKIMDLLTNFVRNIPWPLVVLFCLTLGLAPFRPPHILEKLIMLFHGELRRPLDWFDLFYHALPWFLLILKGLASVHSGGRGE